MWNIRSSSYQEVSKVLQGMCHYDPKILFRSNIECLFINTRQAVLEQVDVEEFRSKVCLLVFGHFVHSELSAMLQERQLLKQ